MEKVKKLSNHFSQLRSFFRVAKLEVFPRTLPTLALSQGDRSETVSYTMEALNLRNHLPVLTQVFVSAPDGFEISLDENSGFSNQVVFGSAGSPEKVVTFRKTIFLRLKSDLAPGTYHGNIFHSNVQTGNVPLPVDGIVGPTEVRMGYYPFSPDYWSLTNGTPANKHATRDATPM